MTEFSDQDRNRAGLYDYGDQVFGDNYTGIHEGTSQSSNLPIIIKKIIGGAGNIKKVRNKPLLYHSINCYPN